MLDYEKMYYELFNKLCLANFKLKQMPEIKKKRSKITENHFPLQFGDFSGAEL